MSMFEVVEKSVTSKPKDMGDFPALFKDLPDDKVLRATLPFNTKEEREKAEKDFGKGDGNKEPGTLVVQARNAAEAINKSARKRLTYVTEKDEKSGKVKSTTAVLEIWLGKRIGRPRKGDAATVETPAES